VISLIFMGRDPVELAKRAKYKPPAMRVSDICNTKTPSKGWQKRQRQDGLNEVKASVFRRWPVTRAYSPRANHPLEGWLLFMYVLHRDKLGVKFMGK